MKKLLAMVMGMTVAFGSVAVQAQGTAKAPPAAPAAAAGLEGTGKILADISAKAASGLAMIQITIKDDIFGSGNIAGMAIVKSVQDGKATLITMILDPRVQKSMVGEIYVIAPGHADKPIKATFLGIDPESSIAYIETIADANVKVDWKPITFAAKSDLIVGKQVFAAGLLDPTLGFAPYVGTAYVSSLLRVPGDLVYVTGGTLTAIGSPVFNANGEAIGIVQQQLPSSVEIMGGRGQGKANVGMRSSQETQYFVPVEEFGAALQGPPQAEKRLPWIGVLNFTTLPAGAGDLLKLGTPAVMVGKVIPGTPADAKGQGLKDGDFITKINGKELTKLATPELTMLNFVRQLMRTPIGEKVKLTYVRGATEAREIEVVAEATPKRPDEAPRAFAKRLGLIVREKVELDKYMDNSPTGTQAGLYVVGTVNGGPAAISGIKTDPQPDLVVQVDGKPVTTKDEFEKAVEGKLATLRAGEAITVVVRRGDSNQSISIVPAAETR